MQRFDVQGARVDAALLARIRASHPAALTEFSERFYPLLRHIAKRRGLRDPERDEVVTNFLGDFLVELIHGGAEPRGLHQYVLLSFEHHLSRHNREREREAEIARVVEADVAGSDECASAIGMSAFTVHATRTRELDIAECPPSIGALYRGVVQRLRGRDVALLPWVIEDAPPREIARAFGIRRGAAKIAKHRLRNTLRVLLLSEIEVLPPSDRVVAVALLKRAGVVLTAGPTTISTDHRPDNEGGLSDAVQG